MHTKTDDLRAKVKTFKLNVQEQKDLGRTIDPSTVKWWQEQFKIAPHLKKMLIPSPDDLSLHEFHQELKAWLKSQGYNKRTDWAWQRGTMDIMQIDDIWKKMNLEQKEFPVNWWKIRDLRTAIDILGETELNGYIKNIREDASKFLSSFTKHDPVSDVLLEVEQLRQCGLYKYEPK